MALSLPASFTGDIQGRDTNLTPIVVINTNPRIFISTNSLSIGPDSTLPILLNIPSIKESIDLEKRDYKISNTSLDISNIPFNGSRFSDIVDTLGDEGTSTNLINVSTYIYWVGPSFFNQPRVAIGDTNNDGAITDADLTNLMVCAATGNCHELYGEVTFSYPEMEMLIDESGDGMGEAGAFGYAGLAGHLTYYGMNVFNGIIRRYDHSTEKVKIVIEDISQSKFNKDFPDDILGSEPAIPEKYRNKPTPEVYGYVDKSPCVIISTPAYIDEYHEEALVTLSVDSTTASKIDVDPAQPEVFIFTDDNYLPLAKTTERGTDTGVGAFDYNVVDQYSVLNNKVYIGSADYENYDIGGATEDSEAPPNYALHPIIENRVICSEIALLPSTMAPWRQNYEFAFYDLKGFYTTNSFINKGTTSLDPSVTDTVDRISGTLFYRHGGGPVVDGVAQFQYLTATPSWYNNDDMYNFENLCPDCDVGTSSFYASHVGVDINFRSISSSIEDEESLFYIDDHTYAHTLAHSSAGPQFFSDNAQIVIRGGTSHAWTNDDGEGWREKATDTMRYWESNNPDGTHGTLGDATEANPVRVPYQEKAGIGVHGLLPDWWANPILIYGDPSKIFMRYWNQNLSEVYNIGIQLEIRDVKLDHYMLVKGAISKDFYARVKGRARQSGGSSPTAPQVINSIVLDGLQHPAGDEPAYASTDPSSSYNNWLYDFTVNKKINGKKLITGISSASPYTTRFDNMGNFRFNTIKKTYITYTINDETSEAEAVYEDVTGTGGVNGANASENHIIKENDVIDFSFSRTKIEDVYTKVVLNYNWDYGLDDFSSKRSLDVYTLCCEDFNESGVYEGYNWSYYGFETDNHNDTTLVIDDDRGKYIRDDETASRYVTWMLSWHMNQHLKMKIKLPLKYMNLEIGDIIRVSTTKDGVLGGVKPYGIDYTIFQSKIAHYQGFQPFFMISATNKNLDSVTIDLIQMHTLWDAKAESWDSDGKITDLEGTNVGPDDGSRSTRSSPTGCDNKYGCRADYACNTFCIDGTMPEGSAEQCDPDLHPFMIDDPSLCVARQNFCWNSDGDSPTDTAPENADSMSLFCPQNIDPEDESGGEPWLNYDTGETLCNDGCEGEMLECGCNKPIVDGECDCASYYSDSPPHYEDCDGNCTTLENMLVEDGCSTCDGNCFPQPPPLYDPTYGTYTDYSPIEAGGYDANGTWIPNPNPPWSDGPYGCPYTLHEDFMNEFEYGASSENCADCCGVVHDPLTCHPDYEVDWPWNCPGWDEGCDGVCGKCRDGFITGVGGGTDALTFHGSCVDNCGSMHNAPGYNDGTDGSVDYGLYTDVSEEGGWGGACASSWEYLGSLVSYGRQDLGSGGEEHLPTIDMAYVPVYGGGSFGLNNLSHSFNCPFNWYCSDNNHGFMVGAEGATCHLIGDIQHKWMYGLYFATSNSPEIKEKYDAGDQVIIRVKVETDRTSSFYGEIIGEDDIDFFLDDQGVLIGGPGACNDTITWKDPDGLGEGVVEMLLYAISGEGTDADPHILAFATHKGMHYYADVGWDSSFLFSQATIDNDSSFYGYGQTFSYDFSRRFEMLFNVKMNVNANGYGDGGGTAFLNIDGQDYGLGADDDHPYDLQLSIYTGSPGYIVATNEFEACGTSDNGGFQSHIIRNYPVYNTMSMAAWGCQAIGNVNDDFCQTENTVLDDGTIVPGCGSGATATYFGDPLLNIQDIVQLANCVLTSTCVPGEDILVTISPDTDEEITAEEILAGVEGIVTYVPGESVLADYCQANTSGDICENPDGCTGGSSYYDPLINVVDIVQVANCVLYNCLTATTTGRKVSTSGKRKRNLFRGKGLKGNG